MYPIVWKLIHQKTKHYAIESSSRQINHLYQGIWWMFDTNATCDCNDNSLWTWHFGMKVPIVRNFGITLQSILSLCSTTVNIWVFYCFPSFHWWECVYLPRTYLTDIIFWSRVFFYNLTIIMTTATIKDTIPLILKMLNVKFITISEIPTWMLLKDGRQSTSEDCPWSRWTLFVRSKVAPAGNCQLQAKYCNAVSIIKY